MTKEYDLSCNIAKTLDLIGDRWTLLVIRDLLNGLTKFNDIKASLKGFPETFYLIESNIWRKTVSLLPSYIPLIRRGMNTN